MQKRSAMRCGLFALVAAAGVAQGEVIIGNLAAPQVSSTVFGSGSTSIFKAVGFAMGSSAYTLESATLAMDMQFGAGNPVVSIWSAGPLGPGSELLVLTNPPNLSAGGLADFVFTAPSAFTLDANQTYWLHIRSEPQLGNPFNWMSTSNVNPPTGPAATFVSYNFNGASSSFYNRFQIEGTIAAPTCRPDLTTTAIPGSPGYGVPNGILNNDDFFYYLAQFAAGNLAVADMTTTAIPGSPGYGVPNGILNNDDFFFYLSIFAAGC